MSEMIDQLSVSDNCKMHLKEYGWALYESNKPRESMYRVCWVHDDNMERFNHEWDVNNKFRPDGRDFTWAIDEVDAIVKVAIDIFKRHGISAENRSFWVYA